MLLGACILTCRNMHSSSLKSRNATVVQRFQGQGAGARASGSSRRPRHLRQRYLKHAGDEERREWCNCEMFLLGDVVQETRGDHSSLVQSWPSGAESNGLCVKSANRWRQCLASELPLARRIGPRLRPSSLTTSHKFQDLSQEVPRKDQENKISTRVNSVGSHNMSLHVSDVMLFTRSRNPRCQLSLQNMILHLGDTALSKD
jgi:hypothetical protein